MVITLENYRGIVDDSVITEIYKKARRLYNRKILNINSTFQGGGVAEMLTTLVPLMNDVGMDVGWRILHANEDFFGVTKKLHNALQGDKIHLTERKKDLYFQTNENFSVYTHIHHDIVVIHDPQPLPLIKFYKKRQPWVWRCHVDLSNPNEEVCEFLRPLILRYDVMIISHEDYRRKTLPIEQRIFHPAIDPLSVKNRDFPEEEFDRFLRKFIPDYDKKPFLLQVSRFDKWKDPEGVIEVFKLVREEFDVRLVLCGSMATDDPEGWNIYDRIERKHADLIKSGDLILINVENNFLVNALQRKAAVVIQKSLREGFGLTVTEALWKARPVVASRVGGIPLQIKDGYNGFLVDPHDTEGFARRIIEIMKDPELAELLGKRGREFVREKFLITRLLSNYMDLFTDLLGC